MPLRFKSQIDDLCTICQGSRFVSMKIKAPTVAHKALSGPGPRAPNRTRYIRKVSADQRAHRADGARGRSAAGPAW